MSGQNDFQVFAGASNANVLTQSAYIALQARLTGFQTGVAQSIQLNKVWRQSSIMAAVMGQFITDYSPAGQALDDGTTATLENNFVAAIRGATRIQTNNPIFYVSPTGSDLNNGLSAARPFQTLQHAVNVIQNTYELLGGVATVNLAAGTYTGAVVCTGNAYNGSIHFVGNTATPSSVVVTQNAAGLTTITAVSGAIITVSGITVINTAAATPTTGSILASLGSSVTIDHVTFGTGSQFHIGSYYGSTVTASIYTISGNAAFHLNAQVGAYISIASASITLTGTPAFTAFALATFGGVMTGIGAVFTGGATGLRYNVSNLGMIITGGGANFFPGNAAGIGSGLTTGVYG